MLTKADMRALAALFTAANGKWSEIDVDPAERRVTVRSCEETITKSGASVADACSKLLKSMEDS